MDQRNDVLRKKTREMLKTVRISKPSRQTRWSSQFTKAPLVTSFFESSVTSRQMFLGGRNMLILSCSLRDAFSTGNLELGTTITELGWLHSPFTVTYHYQRNSGGSTTTTNHSTKTEYTTAESLYYYHQKRYHHHPHQ